MQSGEQTFSKENYRDFFGIQDENEIAFTESIVEAVERIDPTLLPRPFKHPYAAFIAAKKSGFAGLLDVLKSKEEQARKIEALDALANIFLHSGVEESVVTELKALLAEQSEPTMIALYAKCISISQDEAFLHQQILRLADDDPAIVASSARLLGYGAYRPAVEILMNLVSPSRMYESRYVIWALGEIGSENALPVLEHALASAFRTQHCMIALGKIGMMTSIPHLMPFILYGLSEQKDAAYRALASILNKNREHEDAISALRTELEHVIKGQLDDSRVVLQPQTRFFMLLCLARLSVKLDTSQIRRHIGIELNEQEAGQMASFFMRRKNQTTLND